MPNVEHSFVLYALLLEPGGCLRAHITLFELVEPEKKKRAQNCVSQSITPLNPTPSRVQARRRGPIRHVGIRQGGDWRTETHHSPTVGRCFPESKERTKMQAPSQRGATERFRPAQGATNPTTNTTGHHQRHGRVQARQVNDKSRPHKLLLEHIDPAMLEKDFRGWGGGRRYKYTKLPFGWRYSPAICQLLVKSLVCSALQRFGKTVAFQVYLDDILLYGSSRRRLIAATKSVIAKLKDAGFIMSPKSDLSPKRQMVFVGKCTPLPVVYPTLSESWRAPSGCTFAPWGRGSCGTTTCSGCWADYGGWHVRCGFPHF